jgi:hypothetical protein
MPVTSAVQLKVAVSQTIAITGFTLNLTAAGSGFTTTVPIALSINLNDFTLAAAQSTLTIKQGATGQITAAAAPLGSFNSAVYLYWYTLPAGVTASISNYPISAPGNGTSVTTFTVSLTAKAGTYTFSMTGVGYGSLTHTVPVTLTIASK